MDAPNADNLELPAWRPTWLALLIWLAILFAIVGLVTPYIGMGNLMILPLIDLVATISVLWFWMVRGSSHVGVLLSKLVLGLPIIFVAFWLLILMEIGAIEMALYRWPPPRPMFANQFRGSETASTPSWRMHRPDRDFTDSWAWCDFADNVILIYARGERDNDSTPWLTEGRKQCDLHLDDEDNGPVVAIARTHDTLIVVLPSGATRNFPMRPGEAEPCYERTRKRRDFKWLTAAGELLEPNDQAALEELLAAQPK
jgi:hypothetical protein